MEYLLEIKLDKSNWQVVLETLKIFHIYEQHSLVKRKRFLKDCHRCGYGNKTEYFLLDLITDINMQLLATHNLVKLSPAQIKAINNILYLGRTNLIRAGYNSEITNYLGSIIWEIKNQAIKPTASHLAC